MSLLSPRIHDFNERNAFSLKASDEPFWEAVYRKAFPNMTSMTINNDLALQRIGIDRVIELSNGRTLHIDEKKRDRVYQDILLEYLSNDRTGAPGWVEKDLAIDYLAYAFMPTQRCYLYPWPLLRRAWIRYGEEWRRTYPPKKAENATYNTWSTPVPIPELRKAICQAMIIQVDLKQDAPVDDIPF
jgi:hypothetical protein